MKFSLSDIDDVLLDIRSNIAVYGPDEQSQLVHDNSILVKEFEDYFIEIVAVLQIYQEEVIGGDFEYETGDVIPF